MRQSFWDGFEKNSMAAKKHTLVFYFEPSRKDIVEMVAKLRLKNPTVKIKLVNGEKSKSKMEAHKITKLPTLLLLKNGREVDRLVEKNFSQTLLDQFFRKAAA